MSEIINNREYRQKIMKELIMELHQGKDPEKTLVVRFPQLTGRYLTPGEILHTSKHSSEKLGFNML